MGILAVCIHVGTVVVGCQPYKTPHAFATHQECVTYVNGFKRHLSTKVTGEAAMKSAQTCSEALTEENINRAADIMTTEVYKSIR